MANTLTLEQLLPFLLAEEHRLRQHQRGQTILLKPWPPCPDCDADIEQLSVQEVFGSFARHLTVDPCGHSFLVPDQLVEALADDVRHQVDIEENRPADDRPAAVGSIAIHLGSSHPDGEIQQTQIGTVAIHLSPDGTLSQAEFNRGLGDLLVAAGEHLRALTT